MIVAAQGNAGVAAVRERVAPFAAAFSSGLFSLVFMLTGAGCALMGATMPALLAHWSLDDRAGGSLLFLSWLGAALGALCSRGNLSRSLLRGAALAAAASGGLAVAVRGAAFPLALAYGLGLGIVMTSISRLRAERAGSRCSQEMNRLNLLWAAGALACPPMAAHALATSRAAYLFGGLAAALVVASLLIAATEFQPSGVLPRVNDGPVRLPRAPLFFCAISVLVVGTEAALGGWLTTYVKRTGHSVAGAVTATAAFWAGLLLSRALHSTPWLHRLRPVTVLRIHSAIVAPTIAVLLLLHAGWPLPVLAGLVGFGLGPLYPVLLAIVVTRHRGTRVFFSAGMGSAALPWLTGMLSGAAGSLRTGLLVPCAAGCVLLLLVTRVLGSWERAHGLVEGAS